jgi:hypothetical protein
MKFWFLAIMLPGLFAVTDSVWEEPEASPFKEVVVKSISDDGHRIVVTVRQVETESLRETYPLCSSHPDHKATLQQAFDQGKSVSLEFEGRFSRCISQVHFVSL